MKKQIINSVAVASAVILSFTAFASSAFAESSTKDANTVQNLVIAADDGDAQASYRLGQLFESGRGVSRDVNTSIHWYIKSAEQGLDKAQEKVGTDYLFGRGDVIDINIKKGIELLNMAANQGDPEMQVGVGEMYQNGMGGFPVDIKKAYNWYQRAANQGSEIAIEHLSNLDKKK